MDRFTDHICNYLQGFQLRKRLNDEEKYPTLKFVTRIVMQGMGDATLILENISHLELKDCLYVL